jgi:hypothetical protein
MIGTKLNTRSQFVGYFSIKNFKKIECDLILPTVQKFFMARNIQSFKPIDEYSAFADLDFDSKNFSEFFTHFYDFIIDDIHKNEDHIVVPVTYCITLDETNCLKICDQTQTRYDEILLFDTPVFYFIFVDVKDIFSCLRS